VTVMVALLRGVNVGGRSSLAMADLRAVVESCGHRDVRTYIQSGNVVFTTSKRSPDAVAKELEAAIAKATSVHPDVVVRTRAQLAKVVDANPFLRQGEDEKHLHAVFMKPGGPKAKLPDLDRFAPEEAAVVGTECFLLLPGGIGNSKLAAALSRQKGPVGTARSWRTVKKLLDMADDLAAN
jgi:uncharacterized protein (DUF1697 family)